MSRDYTAVTVVAGLDRALGGPSYTVPALVAALSRQGVRGRLITVAGVPGSFHLPADIQVPVQVVPSGFLDSLRVLAKVGGVLGGGGSGLVHVHGLWSPVCVMTSRYARRNGVPLVVSPRGMLEPWAWQHRAWKKRPVWWLWERRNLQQAAVLHATSGTEADNLRALGFRNPIAVLPNGVDLPEQRPVELQRPVAGNEPRIILFLSRIHPKKGLVNLVNAWSRTRPAGWRVVVAGPDEDGHLAGIQALAQRAGVAGEFDFVGAVYGQDKWQLYKKASLFVLPTASENFGVSVAEALSMGVPAITTKGAPWQSLVEQRCGWWIDQGVEPLAQALVSATGCSDRERMEMGLRGAAWVRMTLGWDRIGAEMAQVYDWVLCGGPCPACVRKA